MTPRNSIERQTSTRRPDGRTLVRWLVAVSLLLVLYTASRWIQAATATVRLPTELPDRSPPFLSQPEVQASLRTQVGTMKSLREAYLTRKRARRNSPAVAAARAARENRAVPRGPRDIDPAGRARISDLYRRNGLQYPELDR